MARLLAICCILLVVPGGVAKRTKLEQKDALSAQKKNVVDAEQHDHLEQVTPGLGDYCDWSAGAKCADGQVCSGGGKCLLKLGQTCSKQVFGNQCSNEAYGRGAGIKCSRSAGHKCCIEGMDFYNEPQPQLYAVVNDASDCCSGKIWDPKDYSPPMQEQDTGRGYCKDPMVMPMLPGIDKLSDAAPPKVAVPASELPSGPGNGLYLAEPCNWENLRLGGAGCAEGMICSAGKCWKEIGSTCEKVLFGTECASLAYGGRTTKCSKRAGNKCCVVGTPYTMTPSPETYAVVNDVSDCCSGEIWDPQFYTSAMNAVKDTYNKGFCKDPVVEPYLEPLTSLPKDAAISDQ